ncbi:MAG: 1-acyl-sn-glycerol-3-phosphate acyltransferase [Microthrixaceae bacterium]
MAPLPPKPVRRLVLAPAVCALAVAALILSPFIILFAAFAVRWLPGRWRGLRLLWFLLVYLVRETVGLFALAVLWVLSGFGWKLRSDRFVRAHVLLAGWFVGGLIGSARRVLGLRVVPEEVPDGMPVDEPFRRGPSDWNDGDRNDGDRNDVDRNGADHNDAVGAMRPVLVFSRHAGAGDSFILADQVLNTYGRRPRIVLKDQLQWDPCVDVALGRIPSRFISPNPPPGSGVVDSIADLAAGLPHDGALILFPEGGNFTRRRRTRAINRLREAGLDDLVGRAEHLVHVLPPRPGGAFAAIDAAPGADVVFVAHTGLEQLSSLRQLWSGLPMRAGVRMTWWTVRAEDIPEAYEERITWLYAWWAHIDDWIAAHFPEGTPVGPVPSEPARATADRSG